MTTYDDSLAALLLPERRTTALPDPRRDRPGGATPAPARPGPAPGSSLHEDDLVASPFAVSSYASDLLSHAAGLLDPWQLGDAVSPQSTDPFGLEQRTWAALLHEGLDDAATAVWVLSPEERSVRVTRRLDAEVCALMDLGRLQRLEGQPTETADVGLRLVADAARRHGLRISGHVPMRVVFDAAEGNPTTRQLPAVRALLDEAAHGSPDAVELLSRIPAPSPGTGSDDLPAPSPPLGFRVARAIITTVLLRGEALYDAGRTARP